MMTMLYVTSLTSLWLSQDQKQKISEETHDDYVERDESYVSVIE
jgi:hypothetical protein